MLGTRLDGGRHQADQMLACGNISVGNELLLRMQIHGALFNLREQSQHIAQGAGTFHIGDRLLRRLGDAYVGGGRTELAL